ncbi:MAG: ATPase [Minwuia sp.]|uniref:ATPase n=1 Tax=Minwuia sp. TaxID=2493630 RepID=UPI003A873A5A
MIYDFGEAFRRAPHKAITLLGMSGVGKTMLADRLPKAEWFHYSADYRIGTKYLEEDILDNIKRKAMQVPFLRKLLLSDSIYICSNITVDNLDPISTYLGKIGRPDSVGAEEGGLSYEEFRHRQDLHEQAEIASMIDVARFKAKALEIYGYPNFINDASGSICEIVDPKAGTDDPVLDILSRDTLLLYIRAGEADYKRVEAAAMRNPKPLFYRDDFLQAAIPEYRSEAGLPPSPVSHVDDIDPDDFVKWIFPKLWRHRIPRYQAIADRLGYVIEADEAASVRDGHDFTDLVAGAIDRRQKAGA